MGHFIESDEDQVALDSLYRLTWEEIEIFNSTLIVMSQPLSNQVSVSLGGIK